MAAQQQVIAKFMQSLDQTTLAGNAALDEAVRACSGYSGMDDLIEQFFSDAGDGSRWQSFLEDDCGIYLDNEDTGSVTGSDVGGSMTKTAESIVPEDTAPIETYPDGSFTAGGLTLTVPAESRLTAAEKIIVRGLRSWWLQEGLDLIRESYGMGFEEEGATVRTMDLQFYSNAASSTLASVSSISSYRVGDTKKRTTKLTLNVNMAYFDNISKADKNGEGASSAGYLDRVLAHELTHAVMSANIDNFSDLPDYICEGMAEFTHGIDDFRERDIETLARDPGQLKKWIRTDENVGGDGAYSGGYMLLHYLAKHGSEAGGTGGDSGAGTGTGTGTGTGIGTGAGTGTGTGTGAGTGTGTGTGTGIGTGAGTGTGTGTGAGTGGAAGTGAGTAADGDIYEWTPAESGSYLCNNGKDIIHYMDGCGDDVIYGFASGDEIHWEMPGYSGVSLAQNGLAIHAPQGTITLANAKNQLITVTDAQGSPIAYAFLGDGIANLDGSGFSCYEVITGGGEDDTLRAGSGGSILWGGGASSDALVCGSGSDDIYYGLGDGSDTLYGATAADRVLLYDMRLADVAALSLDARGAVITTRSGGSLLLAGQTAGASSPTFCLADGSWQWDGAHQTWQQR